MTAAISLTRLQNDIIPYSIRKKGILYKKHHIKERKEYESYEEESYHCNEHHRRYRDDWCNHSGHCKVENLLKACKHLTKRNFCAIMTDKHIGRNKAGSFIFSVPLQVRPNGLFTANSPFCLFVQILMRFNKRICKRNILTLRYTNDIIRLTNWLEYQWSNQELYAASAKKSLLFFMRAGILSLYQSCSALSWNGSFDFVQFADWKWLHKQYNKRRKPILCA